MRIATRDIRPVDRFVWAARRGLTVRIERQSPELEAVERETDSIPVLGTTAVSREGILRRDESGPGITCRARVLHDERVAIREEGARTAGRREQRADQHGDERPARKSSRLWRHTRAEPDRNPEREPWDPPDRDRADSHQRVRPVGGPTEEQRHADAWRAAG